MKRTAFVEGARLPTGALKAQNTLRLYRASRVGSINDNDGAGSGSTRVMGAVAIGVAVIVAAIVFFSALSELSFASGPRGHGGPRAMNAPANGRDQEAEPTPTKSSMEPRTGRPEIRW